MARQDAPQPFSAKEEARVREIPAIYANKIYASPLSGGARITFAEAVRGSGQE